MKAWPDPVHEGLASGGFDEVLDRPRGADVVDDMRPLLLAGEGLAQQGGHEVAGYEGACVVDEEAAIGVAVPGDAEVGLFRNHSLLDLSAVFGLQGIRRVVRKGAVEVEVHADGLDGEGREDRRCTHGAHAVAGVEHGPATRYARGWSMKDRQCRA